MEQHWYERFKFWVCDTFGHRRSWKQHYWFFEGCMHMTCKRCGRTFKPLGDKPYFE